MFSTKKVVCSYHDLPVLQLRMNAQSPRICVAPEPERYAAFHSSDRLKQGMIKWKRIDYLQQSFSICIIEAFISDKSL